MTMECACNPGATGLKPAFLIVCRVLVLNGAFNLRDFAVMQEE
jgi:hypothetical protein